MNERSSPRKALAFVFVLQLLSSVGSAGSDPASVVVDLDPSIEFDVPLDPESLRPLGA